MSSVIGNLSYRYKVPLSLSIVIVITTVVLSAVLGWQAYRDLRGGLIASAEGLGRTLSRALLPSLLSDEVWSAYETIMAPLEGIDDGDSPQRTVTVLDAKASVFVSSHPNQFPLLAPLPSLGPSYAQLEHVIAAQAPHSPVQIEDRTNDRILVAVPILTDDGTHLGTVLLTYSESLFLPHFYATLTRVLVSTLLVLLVLVPLGWNIGRRMAVPLTTLAESMAQIGSATRAQLIEGLYRGNDEIGQLGRRFEHMLDELDEKRDMEKQMIAADRLAAIGRLTAGIAHEINNPLGGMINAINTFKHHRHPDPEVTQRTISLLDRGLAQIRETVGALLVEARTESHALTPDDLDDIRLLVQPQLAERAVRLYWDNGLSRTLPLPSTPVRQILINLLLNALQAANPSGTADCRIRCEENLLTLDICNDGAQIPPALLAHLFEPFSLPSESRGSLGLWVTYQLVQQLQGSISVSSTDTETRFVVKLAVEENV
jgi:signal transduction histidine kinase